MIRHLEYLRCAIIGLFILISLAVDAQHREVIELNKDWRFLLDDSAHRDDRDFSTWRSLNLPHDWSIEGSFDKTNLSGSGGAYLPGGIGWYAKTFTLPYRAEQLVSIAFEGVYERSEVWLNGQYLGMRPNGFIGFQYDISTYLHNDNRENILLVKVDNSAQPNARFYTGSGIYRNVSLIVKNKVHLGDLFVKSRDVDQTKATLLLDVPVMHGEQLNGTSQLRWDVLDSDGKIVATKTAKLAGEIRGQQQARFVDSVTISHPQLWSPESPYCYQVRCSLISGADVLDQLTLKTGIRYFHFDADSGFYLNGQQRKIRGVCMHSDLGALGAAFHPQAAKRQLEMLKSMGVNAIRTSHNPAATGFLDLCDSLGFMVMSETFDVWKIKKNPFDYHLYWDDWFERDFIDHIKRDRNHPSLFIWCLGNEAQEQWHSVALGSSIPKRLAELVDSLDGTRPTVVANNELSTKNPVLSSQAVDLLGYNYNHLHWRSFPQDHPNRPLIITESVSALSTRGHYDNISIDTVRLWPSRWDIPFDGGNADKQISAYDHVRTPWGSTHEESLFLSERLPWVSGMYVWTGFDYLGEPTPYTWPARSSYFGIVDMAGFPKDVFYLYQSVWTTTPMLHILPHWNWSVGDTVDVVAYYNCADEVELLLNGKSLGKRAKADSLLHVSWKVPFAAGELKAISRSAGAVVKQAMVRTSGEPHALAIMQEQSASYEAHALAFVQVTVRDRKGTLVPRAAVNIRFEVEGAGELMATDNGNPTDTTSFGASERQTLNGKALAVVRKLGNSGEIRVKAEADGMKPVYLDIPLQKK
ncbi:glycoside hydrolase family 2 TIM barrel-domain containing protein [Sphingobacterium oryzagri]|uniref:Glycoside hydrolase family 2 TIM barrel-domain containing protein n=1 Tax=Sphingobacterium oryzagri TaxID=3025669 RepID=A0ABY7WC24_9SPHI|nr:glycoside hydrolase family 2 TIM barrel-domain containing protein [Sphingobacterium sp. KACC 22765]WDF67022.1 glycoside hydrolase family 2 TIM barrel-domain containing protein [Sphingobacterium sp. KACC 22765]